jgi:hypothetical protein
MRRSATILILCLTICLNSACRKYGDGYVKGTVTDLYTNKSLPGIVVYLSKIKKRQKDGNIFIHGIVDTAVTDQDGNYRISYHKETGYDYSVSPRQKRLLGSQYYYNNPEIEKKKEIRNFIIEPAAYLQIHLKKTSTAPNRVQLNFTEHYAPLDLPTHAYAFDTILPPLYVAGNYPLSHFRWTQLSIDPLIPPIDHRDNLYIKAGDTLVYPITYE